MAEIRQPPVTVISAEGLLFIGDPHITSRRPGRRTDIDFAGNVISALEKALDMAEEQSLQPIITGDLMDRAKESDHTTIYRLIRVLRYSKGKTRKRRPIMIPGNHDLTGTMLTSDTCLAMLAGAGVVNVWHKAGPMALMDLPSPTPDGQTGPRIMVAIGGTPYAQNIPETTTSLFDPAIKALRQANKMPEHFAAVEAPHFTIWLTHDDLAIGPAYPGAKEIAEIPGCDMVVNGHMHATLPPNMQGQTCWFNPGNITRLRVSERDHDESIWIWRPSAAMPLPREDWAIGYLSRISLAVERNVFDYTGLSIGAADPNDALAGLERMAVGDDDDIDEGKEVRRSVFVELLSAQSALDMAESQDGSVLIDEVTRLAEEKNTFKPAAIKLVRAMAGEDWNLEKVLEVEP